MLPGPPGAGTGYCTARHGYHLPQGQFRSSVGAPRRWPWLWGTFRGVEQPSLRSSSADAVAGQAHARFGAPLLRGVGDAHAPLGLLPTYCNLSFSKQGAAQGLLPILGHHFTLPH